jgi:hypothetical protein
VLWPVTPTSESDELWDVVVSGDGQVWVNGTAQFDVSARPYSVKSGADGANWCGWEAPFTNQGLGRGLTSDGGKVYMTGVVDGQAFVYGYPESACLSATPCACTPTVQIRFGDADSLGLEGRELVVSGNDAWVGGHRFLEGGDTDPFVARVDLTTGSVLALQNDWHPSDNHDSYFSISVADSDHGIGVGYLDLTEPKDRIRGFVRKLRAVDLGVVWSHEEQVVPSAYFRAQTDAASGIVIIGAWGSMTTGMVMRCTAEGICP